MERRLAAILAADVVGYSRLMGEDEAGTLDALRAHREALIEPKIAEHDGRIVKLMGDGLLAEFPSAVEAVQCAIEIQNTMGERNAGISKSSCDTSKPTSVQPNMTLSASSVRDRATISRYLVFEAGDTSPWRNLL